MLWLSRSETDRVLAPLPAPVTGSSLVCGSDSTSTTGGSGRMKSTRPDNASAAIASRVGCTVTSSSTRPTELRGRQAGSWVRMLSSCLTAEDDACPSSDLLQSSTTPTTSSPGLKRCTSILRDVLPFGDVFFCFCPPTFLLLLLLL